MVKISNNPGCCPHSNAKIFEIILIIGFLLTIILLIINLALTIWFFKNSHSLFIIEIGLLGLNALSFILSIILRIWRSDGSVLNSNLSSSNTVAVINLIFVIINFLLSIAEEILFSFVFPFIILQFDDDISLNDFSSFFNEYQSENDEHESENDEYEYNFDFDFDEFNFDFDMDDWEKDPTKEEKNFYKIMDRLDEENGLFDDDNYDEKEILKKFKILKILPWITFNFNTLIQFMMFIFIIILIGRIKRRSDFGFSRNVTNQTSQNTMSGKRKSSDLKKLGLRNIDSAQKNLGKKKHKKKSKRKSIRVHNKY